VAYLSRFMVEQEIRSGVLHEINIQSPHVFALWLATKKGKVLSVQARTFIQRLKQAWN
jgi:DNA-binding transcriptional LysR family regulator